MDYITYMKRRFPNTSTLHYTYGKNALNGIFECGFIWKPKTTLSDCDILFNYYGGLIVLDGTGIYTDETGVEYPLYPGCFIQRIPGKKHSTIVNSDGNWFEAFVCFGTSLYHCYEELGFINRSTPVLNTGVNSDFLQSFVDLYDEANRSETAQLPCLINKAVEIVINAHELNRQNNDLANNNIIRKACKIIEANYCMNLSAQDIAMQLNIGYEKFRKLFKAEMGISPNYFIIQKKINGAKSLLLRSKRSINEIALELGYSDQFSFSKQFKKMTGMSPLKYRQTLIF